MPALRQHTTLNYLCLNTTTVSTGILFIYVTFSVVLPLYTSIADGSLKQLKHKIRKPIKETHPLKNAQIETPEKFSLYSKNTRTLIPNNITSILTSIILFNYFNIYSIMWSCFISSFYNISNF